MSLLWIGFVVLFFAFVALDLSVLRRITTRTTPNRSAAHAGLWICVGLGLGVAIYFLYGNAIARPYVPNLPAGEAALQYLCSFLIELAMGLNSAFVMSAVFSHMGVHERLQHRVLMLGTLLAVPIRVVMVLAAGTLLHADDRLRFLFSAFMLVAAVRMVVVPKENVDPDKNLLLKVIKKVAPVSDDRRAASLVTTQEGKPALTPLVLPLILMETADAFFALDSIPASYAYTREPLLIFVATCMSMLVIRSAAPLLMRQLARIRYYKLGLASIFVFSAALIALPTAWVIETLGRPAPVHTLNKLAFVAIAILIGIVAAWIGSGQRTVSTVSEVSPLGEDADRVARQALAGVRRLFVGFVGFTGLLLGAVMALGPGPGIPILFISLVLLATEFAWARVLVTRYRGRAEKATFQVAEQTRRRIPMWLAIAFVVLSCAGAVAIGMYFHLHPGLVISGAAPLVIGQLFVLYLAYFHKRPPASS